jgi:hypothetical protein
LSLDFFGQLNSEKKSNALAGTVSADFVNGDKALSQYFKKNLVSLNMLDKSNFVTVEFYIEVDTTCRVEYVEEFKSYQKKTSAAELALIKDITTLFYDSKPWKSGKEGNIKKRTKLYYTVFARQDSIRFKRGNYETYMRSNEYYKSNSVLVSSNNITEAVDIEQPPPPPDETNPVRMWDYEEVFVVVEEMPVYPGGQAAFDQDLKLAMKQTKQTKEAKEKLFVKFIVDKTGAIKNPVVIQEGSCVDCKAALLEGILKLKTYKAGRQNGRAVNVSLTVPVAFNIN